MKYKILEKRFVLLTAILLISVAVVTGCLKKDLNKKSSLNETSENETSILITDAVDDSNLMAIETPFCDLYYPNIWGELIEINSLKKDIGYTVSFYGNVHEQQIHLFDICFGGDEEGIGIGSIADCDGVYRDIIAVIPNLNFDETWSEEEMNVVYDMQEGVNILINKLKENENYF